MVSVAALAIGVAGCGDGGSGHQLEEAGSGQLHEIEAWVADLDQAETDVSITEFEHDPELPKPPVTHLVVRRFNLAATFAGDAIVSRVQEVSRFTKLSEEQKVELGCFLVEKTVAGEISLDRPDLEGLVTSFLIGHVIQPMPAASFTYGIDELGTALEDADSSTQQFADLTVTATCTYREYG